MKENEARHARRENPRPSPSLVIFMWIDCRVPLFAHIMEGDTEVTTCGWSRFASVLFF